MVTEIRRAADASPARWLTRPDVRWWDLVRYGPPGFDVYMRVTLFQKVEGDRVDGVRAALAALAACTTTPEHGYAAVWEGWGPPAPEAPRVHIPNREMLLFTGPVETLRDAPSVGWGFSSGGDSEVEPHLVWPEDQAWCLACEVDEEIEFTVGCCREASEALRRAFPGAARAVDYGAELPPYRAEIS